MLVGYCDDLSTPRTLGPFRDLVGTVGAELSAVLRDGGDRDRLLSALRSELDWPAHPAVLVIEDIHWADDATLDALRYLIRRVAGLPAVLVLTYRDDELDRDHPVHGLLGQASRAEQVRHLPLRRLSAEAVRQLSTGSQVSPADVYTLTSGNPFFVRELLESAAGGAVPPSVTEAVLARVRRLAPGARDVIEQLAVVPAAADRWLAEALAPAGDLTAALAAGEQGGLLTVSPRRITFRHELTRRAIAGAVPAARLMALNQRVLDALTGHPGADLSQVMHYAAQAGDMAAIIAHGPGAARDAATAGAHREAVAHYRLVLEQAGRFGPAERADLLDEYAVECYTLGAAEATAAQQQAVALRRELGDPARLGASLRWLSRICWWEADRGAAERAGSEAVAVLEQAGDPRLLALALSNQSQLCMLANRAAEAIAAGQRAVALARQAGDPAIISHALTNIGTSQFYLGDPASLATMDEGLEIALRAGDTEDACRAYANIIWSLLDWFRLAEAERYLDAASRLAQDQEFLAFLSYMHVERARLDLARCRWDTAARHAERGQAGHPQSRCAALIVTGRIRARAGQPGARAVLAEARGLAVRAGELQRLGPAAAALAEEALLRGDLAAARAAAAPAYELARQLEDQVYHAELAYLLGQAGEPVPVTGGHPYALLAAGRWQEAAAVWAAACCPYEHAAALAPGGGDAVQHRLRGPAVKPSGAVTPPPVLAAIPAGTGARPDARFF